MISERTSTNSGAAAKLPPEVLDRLRAAFGAPDAAPDRCALADLTADGRFAETWVALLDRALAIAPAGAPPQCIPLDAGTEVEILAGAGASRFRVVRDGRLAAELRYSARQARDFSALCHRAEAFIRGETPPPAAAAAAPAAERLCAKCGKLIPDWADSCPRCLHRRRILWRLLSFALPHRRLMIVGLASAIVLTFLQMVPPLLTKLLIDDVLTDSPHRRPERLWPLIGILAAVTAARLLFGYLRLNRFARLSELMTHDLRTQVFEHLQKLDLNYYAKKPTGNLISRVTHDIDRLWDFIAFGVVDSALSLVTVAGVAVILFLREPTLAALTIAPVPLGLLLMWAHVKRIHRLLSRLWTNWSRMTSILSDVIPGARVVKAFTQERREARRFRERSQSVVDDAMEVTDEWTRFWPRLTLLLNLGTLVIWTYAAPRILNRTFELGTFVMFLGYVWMFYGPIEHLGQMNRMFQRAITSAHRVFEVLDTPPTIFTKAGAVRGRTLAGRVEFDNVSFSYDGVQRVLRNVSFTVEPGTVVGLAGASGSGKTTLINLLCRFYDPFEGRILLDGVDLRDYDLHELRAQIGVVLQEPYLFRGSVAQNIAYGCPDASRERIIAAAKAANAHDFIVGFPDGYDTLVGERGQTLSGGERQRLSIARAVINNPRLLIFDEATSSVDTQTERQIQAAIDRLVRGRTTFAIAHRLSTLRRAHRLLILDKGRLVEQGTHEELIALNGVYAGLHKTQNELHALFAV